LYSNCGDNASEQKTGLLVRQDNVKINGGDLKEGEAILTRPHMGVVKAARFFSAWRQGSGNYLKIREKLFECETVDTLYNKIKEFENLEKQRI
jgi:hypothetical protein